MPAMTLRNIPEDVHRALKARAARHGRSAEAELRVILTEAVGPDPATHRKGLGTEINEAFRRFDLTDEEMKGFARERTLDEPISFE